MLFEPGFTCGGVLIDQGDFHAMFFLELQLAQAIRSDVAGIDAQICATAKVFTGKSKRLAEGFLRAKLSSELVSCQKHRHNQYYEDRFAHVRPPPLKKIQSAGPNKVDISGGGTHLQHRSAAIQIPFGGGGAGSPLAAFTDDSDLGEVRANTWPFARSMEARMVMLKLGAR